MCPTLYLSRHSRYLMCKFCDLDLRQLKVIQGQRSWCQSIAHSWVISYSTSIDPIIIPVTSFQIFDVQFWWPWTSTVQGHPRSKVIVSIGRPSMVFTARAYARAVLGVVILSVCHTRGLWQTKWRTADILIPHERAITLLLWYQEWLVGDAPFPCLLYTSDAADE